jgi:DNA-binding NarL/FixJ family response regulator
VRRETDRRLSGVGSLAGRRRTRTGARVTIKVLVADDQTLVRSGFRMILAGKSEVEVVAEAADGLRAVAETRRTQPDVVLMDIQMPGLNGIDATRRIVREESAPRTRVIILTTFDADEYVVDALRAGASGFLLKDVEPDDLVGAIRTVAAGDALLAPSVTRRLLDRFAERLTISSDRPATQLAQLSERELEVLRLLARGLSNREIGDELVLTEPTVKSHVSHLLTKLDLRDRTQAVIFAYEAGLIRPGAIQQSGAS